MATNLRIMAEALGGDPSLIAELDTSNVPGADQNVEQSE
jgi:manganese/iron transport system substrate-binding protein